MRSPHESFLRNIPSRIQRPLSTQAGKIGWALLWLLGVPLPILFIVYLVRGH